MPGNAAEHLIVMQVLLIERYRSCLQMEGLHFPKEKNYYHDIDQILPLDTLAI